MFPFVQNNKSWWKTDKVKLLFFLNAMFKKKLKKTSLLKIYFFILVTPEPTPTPTGILFFELNNLNKKLLWKCIFVFESPQLLNQHLLQQVLSCIFWIQYLQKKTHFLKFICCFLVTVVFPNLEHGWFQLKIRDKQTNIF